MRILVLFLFLLFSTTSVMSTVKVNEKPDSIDWYDIQVRVTKITCGNPLNSWQIAREFQIDLLAFQRMLDNFVSHKVCSTEKLWYRLSEYHKIFRAIQFRMIVGPSYRMEPLTIIIGDDDLEAGKRFQRDAEEADVE